ncbi:MAG: 4-alpha-glucanotransferase [Chromatiales bacterium]|jgi:4-alpha-glucanotransferase
MAINPLKQRRAGILLHPTSLPSGKLEQDVEPWLNFMQAAGLTIWQMLPIVIPDHTGSPYQSCSAFAMNPALFDIDAQAIEQIDKSSNLLIDFIKQESDWLLDFALFKALKQRFGDIPWKQWPDEFKYRDPEALEQLQEEKADEIEQVILTQFLCFQRWRLVRQQANQKGIFLFGDMPIFVAYDSADVWANPKQFLLDEQLNPTFVAGVPPDYFSATGQLWGNPHYNWEAMRQDGFAWWKARILHKLDRFDIVRIDHFRGLSACWMVPADAETAIDGEWVDTPGDELLTELQASIQDLPIVAEDLGVITEDVVALKKKYELPGMVVLQFAFDSFADNPHKPKNITANNIVYTGTHDNNTTAGWFNELQPNEQQFVLDVLELPGCQKITDCMIDTALKTRASTAIFPLQDLLGLGGEARMNTPGQTDRNWQWRFQWSDIPEDLAQQMHDKIKKSGRLYAN